MSGCLSCLVNDLPSPKQGVGMQLNKAILSKPMSTKGSWGRGVPLV